MNKPANQTLRINAATTIGFTTANALTIGVGTAGIDYILKFDGETNDGTITYLEDEDQFLLSSKLRVPSIWHAFGGFQDAAEAISINADTWTKVTNAGGNLWVGTEADGVSLSSDEMTITNAGDYFGQLSLTFSGDNQKDYLFRVYNITTSTQSGYHIGATGFGANNYTNVSVPLYLEAAAGNVFKFEVYQLDGSDIVVYNSIFYLSYLHD